MLSIKNNLMAANAARHLGKSYDSLAKSVERLSSGLRINSSKDDAAGLAVRELVRADVATLVQGARNARDAISMLQTGEGAMGVIDDILIRMKELSEQAATESYSLDQRDIMDAEFQELGKEITRIATSTKFNDIQLLYSTTTYSIHIGTTDTIDITAENMDGEALGLTKSKTVSVNNQIAADQTASWLDATAGNITFDYQFAGEVATNVVFANLAGGGQNTYSLAEVVDKINVESLKDANGKYKAATLVYNSDTKVYSLKLSAKAGGNKALTIALDDASALDKDNFITTAGSDTGVDIKTVASADSALGTIDDAIKAKDKYRASLGYMMNRLEAAVSILDIQAENLGAAESRISDVDVATEMAAMTRTQVLSQAGISMLAQANMMPQMALKLLA